MTDKKNLEFDSIGVLAYIVKRCVALKYDINLTKGQKLLYCCYGVVLAKLGLRLCKEHPKAWQYGPAFPRAYTAHSKNMIILDKDPISNNCPSDVKEIIDDTIKHFGQFTASSLTNWTHKPGSPWSVCSDNGSHLYGDISDSIIKIYFLTNVLDESNDKRN